MEVQRYVRLNSPVKSLACLGLDWSWTVTQAKRKALKIHFGKVLS